MFLTLGKLKDYKNFYENHFLIKIIENHMKLKIAGLYFTNHF